MYFNWLDTQRATWGEARKEENHAAPPGKQKAKG
jgi:hypothetical protein